MQKPCPEKPLLLVFPYNVMAHYLRCLQLTKYLRRYFTVRFLYSDRYHSFLTKENVDSFECAALDADRVQRSVASFNFSWLNDEDLDHIYRNQLKVLEELRPAAVLGDMSPTLKMAAEKTGTFYISLMNAYMTQYYAYVRRMPRRYHFSKFFNLLPDKLTRYFTGVGEAMFFHQMHRPFSKIRKRSGLVQKHSYMQELEGDCNLLCDLAEIFPQNNLPRNYYFIPPLYMSQTGDDSGIAAKLDHSKKTVYVTMGSTGNWNDVQFLNDPWYRKYNVVTAGDAHSLLNGPNVFSYPFVNDRRFFNLVDLVICHGGNGTVYQALSCHIPVLCKTTHMEQEYNVDGFERLQLVKCLNNVEDENDLRVLVDEWVQKKGTKPFAYIANKIAEAEAGFNNIIDKLLEETYYQNTVQ